MSEWYNTDETLNNQLLKDIPYVACNHKELWGVLSISNKKLAGL